MARSTFATQRSRIDLHSNTQRRPWEVVTSGSFGTPSRAQPAIPTTSTPIMANLCMLGVSACRADGLSGSAPRVPPRTLGFAPRDVMADERPAVAAMEAGGGLEQDAVGGGDALVLAEVLEPRLDHEHLEPAVR